MSSSARKILVTGASGMLGSHIVDRLVKDGATVIGTDLTPPIDGYGWEAQGVEFRQADITTSAVANVLCGVDCIVHTAAMLPAPDGDRIGPLFEVNVAATHRLFERTAERGLKVVFASSGSVYGQSRPVLGGMPAPAFEESDATVRLDFYSLGKRVSEMYADAFARSTGMRWNALRCGVLYGPRLRMGLSTRFLLSVLDDVDAGRTPAVDGDPDAGMDWIDVRLAAECFAAAALCDVPNGPLNVSTGVAVRLEDVLTTLIEESGSCMEIEWTAAQPTGVFSGARYYDTTRTRRQLSLTLESDLRGGLRRFIEWRRGVRSAESQGTEA